MDAPTLTNLQNRIKFFLIEHTDSTALQISRALNVSRQQITGVIEKTPGISAFNVDGVRRFTLAVRDAVAAPELSKLNPIESALNNLRPALKAKLVAEMDGWISEFVDHETAIAIEAIQCRVKSRLAFRLSGGSDEEKAPRIEPIGKLIPPAKVSYREALSQKGVIQEQKDTPRAFSFTNPAGPEITTHDVVSKRTAHREKIQSVIKSTSVGQPVPPQKKKMPKVVIVGIHTNKQSLIRKEYGKKFDLRMYNPDQLAFIKKAINHGDNVLCMADFIGHQHTEVVTSNGGVMEIIHGGMITLRENLNARLGMAA